MRYLKLLQEYSKTESSFDMKIIRSLSRIIAGLIFIFSGTVKAIDPLGSAYKFHDYFHAFHLGFLDNLSLPLAILLCTTEFIAGFSVLTGIRFKTGLIIITILMAIFTPLTFVLALTNPVSDCGCFGDAVHLTNWQTFGKNIVLLLAVVILFIERKNAGIAMKKSLQWIIAAFAAAVFISFTIFNLTFLPVIDFLPYSTGTYIPDKMKIPEGAAATKYETTFIYEKDGKKQEFTLSNYPATDSSWKFIEQKSKLAAKGYQPPIHDFIITSSDNRNITDSVLASPRPILLMISKKLGEADSKKLKKGFEEGKKCLANGIGFIILTASGTDEIASYSNGLQFCLTDETTLKTMVRSNPGYILLRNGTIAGKWSWADLPGVESLLKIQTIKQ
jgi:hypothetical protein